MLVSRRIFLKLELPLVRKLSFCVVFLDNATCSVFARSTEREVSYRCCLGSFLIAWVRRMSAKHCLELVIASPVCQLLHMVGPAPVSSKVVGDSDSRMSVRSLFFFSSIFTPSACRVPWTSVRRHALFTDSSMSAECTVHCACVARRDFPNRACFDLGQSRMIVRWSRMSPLSLDCHHSGSLSSSLGHHIRQFCCWVFQVWHTGQRHWVHLITCSFLHEYG